MFCAPTPARKRVGTLGRPPINVCASPPPRCLRCAASWGTISVRPGEGPPLHCPDPSPLHPKPQERGVADGIPPPPVLTARVAYATGGWEPAAVAAGLAKEGGGVLGSLPFSQRFTLGLSRGFGENSGSLPTAGAVGGLHCYPKLASGHRAFLWPRRGVTITPS